MAALTGAFDLASQRHRGVGAWLHDTRIPPTAARPMRDSRMAAGTGSAPAPRGRVAGGSTDLATRGAGVRNPAALMVQPPVIARAPTGMGRAQPPVMSARSTVVVACVLAAALAAPGCTDDDARAIDDEWGMDGPIYPSPPPGKEDSEFRRGLPVNTDTTRTQVWSARNAWEDTTTAAARAAGLAWPATSGLTWDAKYAAWVQSLGWIAHADGYSQTVRLTTPWGKTLDSPSLECAEMSLFLRITFAAWYELPLFIESVDSSRQRVFFGHNGVRTANGRYASSPEFAIRYQDHSKLTVAQYQAAWPEIGRASCRERVWR